eukprot:TRINITY_DN2557_c0_g2_i1.p1 TRINITY_DN2557_c0_g2~~TRINITY_DN2557_c0_g2_i1.p1  ORF type:complete len:1209 (+),score=285.43 TRINITY_DN2557_c0_g2_i1:78-3704(+)
MYPAQPSAAVWRTAPHSQQRQHSWNGWSQPPPAELAEAAARDRLLSQLAEQAAVHPLGPLLVERLAAAGFGNPQAVAGLLCGPPERRDDTSAFLDLAALVDEPPASGWGAPTLLRAAGVAAQQTLCRLLAAAAGEGYPAGDGCSSRRSVSAPSPPPPRVPPPVPNGYDSPSRGQQPRGPQARSVSPSACPGWEAQQLQPGPPGSLPPPQPALPIEPLGGRQHQLGAPQPAAPAAQAALQGNWPDPRAEREGRVPPAEAARPQPAAVNDAAQRQHPTADAAQAQLPAAAGRPPDGRPRGDSALRQLRAEPLGRGVEPGPPARSPAAAEGPPRLQVRELRQPAAAQCSGPPGEWALRVSVLHAAGRALPPCAAPCVRCAVGRRKFRTPPPRAAAPPGVGGWIWKVSAALSGLPPELLREPLSVELRGGGNQLLARGALPEGTELPAGGERRLSVPLQLPGGERCGELVLVLQRLDAKGGLWHPGRGEGSAARSGPLAHTRHSAARPDPIAVPRSPAWTEESRPAAPTSDNGSPDAEGADRRRVQFSPSVSAPGSPQSGVELAPGGADESPDVPPTDERLFESPVQPMAVSGGTAAFFKLLYRSGAQPPGVAADHWIGKDLSRASDEVEFYQTAFESQPPMRGRPGWELLRWMFDYGGIREFVCDVGMRGKRKLLLLRNLASGMKKLRLLDIKLGAVTAVGGWRGKTHAGAWINRRVDAATNSQVEGYRTEGFSSMPEALDTLLSAGQSALAPESPRKALKRRRLQRLTAEQFLQWFTLLPVSDGPSTSTLTSTEVGFCVLRSTVRQLYAIAADAARLPVPQQWIGSSVGICYDAALGMEGSLPPREGPLPEARICLFDWGRAELLRPEEWETLSPEVRGDRVQHWEQWLGAASRLSFEALRCMRLRYCPVGGWRSVRFRIWDHNVMSGNDPIGSTDRLPLKPSQAVQELPLRDEAGAPVPGAVLTVRIERSEHLPEGAPLKARHVIRVISARRLPKKDVIGHCDPCVTVCLSDAEGTEVTAQTSVHQNTPEATWDMCFDFGEAAEWACRPADLLPAAMRKAAPDSIWDWNLPRYNTPLEMVDRAVTEFQRALPDSSQVAVKVTVLNIDKDNQGRLGVTFCPQSMLVSKVSPGGPAHAAGLRPGQYLVSIDGQSVNTEGQYFAALQKSGHTVRVGVSDARDDGGHSRSVSGSRRRAMSPAQRRLSKAWISQ